MIQEFLYLKAGGDILHNRYFRFCNERIKMVYFILLLYGFTMSRISWSAFDVNILGTFNVMDACVKNNISRLVYSSSASVYGDAEREPMDEDHPYNNNKIFMELPKLLLKL